MPFSRPSRSLGRLRPLALGAVSLLLLGAVAPASPAWAEEAPAAAVATPALTGGRVEYEVWAGGLKILKVALVLKTEEERYRFDLDATLVGPPSWVKDYSLHAVAEGRMHDGLAEPLLYRQEAQDDGEPKWLQLAYSGDLPLVEGDPSPAKERREQVDDTVKRGTQDPLTAVLSMLLQVAAKGSCDGTAPVFDGRRRFDVELSDIGPGELGKSRINAYAGPVRLCGVTLEPIAGYRFSGSDRVAFPADVTLQAAEVLPGLPMLPVRLDTTTSYGVIIIHMVSFEPLG